MRLHHTLSLLCLLTACTQSGDNVDTGDEPPVEPDPIHNVFVLEVSDTLDTWMDFAYLATIPTSHHLSQGTPAVLAVRDAANLSVTTSDLLKRMNPKAAFVLNSDTAVPHAETTDGIQANSASEYSLALVDTLWTQADHIVLASSDDYAGSILAASLASFLEGPLVFSDDLSTEAFDILKTDLNAQTVVSIHLNGTSEDLAVDHALTSVEDTLTWLTNADMKVPYLTVSNPEDRTQGRNQKSSLFAPMYAARRGGLSLPFTMEMPTQVVPNGAAHPVVDFLQEVYTTLGYHPEYLALVGAHDALPQTRKPSIFDNPEAEHPVSDLPYGEADSDPFLDIAIGRVVGDTVFELSDIATRTSQYENLLNGDWEYRFMESGLWGFDELRAIMLNSGFDAPEHLSQQEIEERDFLEVSAILHKDHSYCQVLGNAFEIDTPTLFAPSIVLSRGCSVGGIDLLSSDRRAIVEHMLGSGAVAFIGASRNSIAHNTIIEISLWNELLAGQPLGKAFRKGINDTIVHWKDENSSGFRYSLDIEMLYGDPALTLFVPESPITAPAQHTVSGQTVTVVPPEEWTMVQYLQEQLDEWSYGGDLYMYVGAGASPKTYWSGQHDSEDPYYGVQVQLDSAPASITQTTSHNSPLGWHNNHYIDTHQDGTVTALWRVRLLAFEENTGDITEASPEFVYTME